MCQYPDNCGMSDILDLPGWKVLSQHTDGKTYDIEAEYTVQTNTCQKCGVIDRLYRHGVTTVVYRDSPIRGCPTSIKAKVQRWKCRDCGETFQQPLAGIHADVRMTERCVTYIQRQSLLDTFVRIAEHIGCDDKTVRTVAGSYMEELARAYRPKLPAWLGIDETQIDGKMRCVITDVGTRKPIDMLADRSRDTLATWLNHFRERRQVMGVAIDMWRPYRDVAHQLLPGAPVVIDKFHVVRTASYCMERVRIRLQKVKKAGERRDWMRSKPLLNMRYAQLNEKQRFNVDMWLDNTPELAAAHRLKEAFFDIYDLPRKQAIAAYDAFPATVPDDLRADFKVLLTMMRNWRTEILAYFSHPITNAYTEALNGVAKTINRTGRGYSFEVLRARLLFGRIDDVPDELPTPVYVPYDRPIPPRVRKTALETAGCRCHSCRGVFETSELDLHRTLPGLDNMALLLVLCKVCHHRFHTDELTVHSVLSTE